MEINDLRIFQMVAYEKSISKAALNLGYAQSNITMRIKVLENELNTTLFYDKNPSVSLVLKTEKQEILLDKLSKHELDGAFIYDEYPSIKFKEVFSFMEETALISSTPIKDINNITTPIIVNTDTYCPYGKLLKKWFAINHSSPVNILEFDTLESILNGVNSGLGVSLLPKSILPKDNDFHVYDLGEDFKKLKLKFIINDHVKHNASLKRFVDISKEYINR